MEDPGSVPDDQLSSVPVADRDVVWGGDLVPVSISALRLRRNTAPLVAAVGGELDGLGPALVGEAHDREPVAASAPERAGVIRRVGPNSDRAGTRSHRLDTRTESAFGAASCRTLELESLARIAPELPIGRRRRQRAGSRTSFPGVR